MIASEIYEKNVCTTPLKKQNDRQVSGEERQTAHGNVTRVTFEQNVNYPV